QRPGAGQGQQGVDDLIMAAGGQQGLGLRIDPMGREGAQQNGAAATEGGEDGESLIPDHDPVLADEAARVCYARDMKPDIRLALHYVLRFGATGVSLPFAGLWLTSRGLTGAEIGALLA